MYNIGDDLLGRNTKKKRKKKKKNTGKVAFMFIVIVMLVLGAYLGYSISINGGGLQGLLATILNQDANKLKNLDTIHVLLLRSQSRSGFRINGYHYGLFL